MRAHRQAVLLLALGFAMACSCSKGGGNAPGPTSGGINAANHTFFPVASGVHAVDCNLCHGGFASFKQFTCFAACHGHDQAPTDAVHVNIPSYVYDSNACYSCHKTGSAAGFAGVAHDPKQDLSVTALLPSYQGTMITGFSQQIEIIPMLMNHGTTQLPAGVLGACTNCHPSAGAGAYYPGNLHTSLAALPLAQPMACSDCHGDAAPEGFVGPLPTTALRSPSSGPMKHDAVAWSNGLPTATPLVTSDCGVCHVPPTTADGTWSDGPTTGPGAAPSGGVRFHDSLARAGQPQPGSCVDCHANSQPTVPLTTANALGLPPNVQLDHASIAQKDDCATCHAASAPTFSTWSGGRFHVGANASPGTCLPCHTGERPTSTAGWASTTFTQSPFDYGTNTAGITHGAGADCVLCHASTQSWVGGHFPHGPGTPAASTCISCHTTQRPDLQTGTTPAAMASLLGFDHSINGTGDCFGCHQATVTAGSYVHFFAPGTNTLPGGDWKGGQTYPGSTLVGSLNQFITVTQITLNRSGPNNLVTSITSVQKTLYNQMLHVSAALPAELSAGPSTAPDYSKCWHCHTNNNGTVTAYAEGQYHSSLTSFSATPGGTVTPLAQPTSGCDDCHAQMRPPGIVQLQNSNLHPMDHIAEFAAPVTIGSVVANGVADLGCSTCHASPGNTWADGRFHSQIAGGKGKDCSACHYTLMADATKADVASGTLFKMAHKSVQLTFQNCSLCHANAFNNTQVTPVASTLWSPGTFHPNLTSQPTLCIDCHAVTQPAANAPTQSSISYTFAMGGTSSNGAQWMNHGSRAVVGKDCVNCHAADAKTSGSAWSKADRFHTAANSTTTCQECHGLTNGKGTVPGTNNNMPAGKIDSATLTSASSDPSTGVPPGTHAQIDHGDVNVTGHDCNFCHTQVGSSTAAGVIGKEWAQARFHQNFSAGNPLVMNTTTGRCSHCHLNSKPGASFTAQNHSGFTDASGSQDCSGCHAWPGTGGASNANWLGASGGAPAFITVGGFTVPAPPASPAKTQPGISNLPHPSVSAGATCTSCHTSPSGGRPATGYDHASTLITKACSACHEAGSNLVGTPWNGATTESARAGDTRPFTLTSIQASRGTSRATETQPNHFYPVDCGECHNVPAGVGTTTTGTAYLKPAASGTSSSGAWAFPHNTSKMTNPGTCVMCHPNGIP